MPRPSQCRVCGCFEACLAGGADGCAADAEQREIATRRAAAEHAYYGELPANYEIADEQGNARP